MPSRIRMSDHIVSIVGIVFDGKRLSEGDFELTKCTVFGISSAEYKVLHNDYGVRMLPAEFSSDADRYLVNENPYTVMRILGTLGYELPARGPQPMVGRPETATGERMQASKHYRFDFWLWREF